MKKIKLAIISAIEVEYRSIINLMKSPKNYYQYTIGKINGVKCLATQAGIGALASQRAVTEIRKIFKPKYFIFSGIAGSQNPQIKIGQVVVSGFVCAKTAIYFSPNSVLSQYTAVQLKEDDQYINSDIISGYKYPCEIAQKFGGIISVIGSCDFYIASKAWNDAFVAIYHADAETNEGIGFAYACESFNIPFLIVRGISDSVFQPGQTDDSLAAHKAADIVHSITPYLKHKVSRKRIKINDLNSISLASIAGKIVTNNVAVIPPKVIK